MNMYLIIIGALLVVLLVAFGHNPMEEARQARAKRGGDQLVNAIDDYNKKTHPFSAGGILGTIGSIGAKGPPASAYPPYMMNNHQAASSFGTSPYQQPQQPQQNPQSNSYYPPSAAPASPQQPQAPSFPSQPQS